MRKNYVILIAPETPRGYLGQAPDEDDGQPATSPERTSDVEHALQFRDFALARAALKAASKRHPTHQFSIDVTPGATA